MRERGFTLIEATIVLGTVALIAGIAAVAFGFALHAARAQQTRDAATLDAYNVATSLRAAMRYDRGAVAAIGAAPAASWTLGTETIAAVPGNGSLTLTVTQGSEAAALVLPLYQEVPAPQSTVPVP
jgi:type II secretory pathway pseudopilin PulG